MKRSRLAHLAVAALLGIFLSYPVMAQVTPGPRGLGMRDAQVLRQAVTTAERASPAEAVAAMRAAVEQFKSNPTAWYYYGVALVRAGDYESARDAFKQAVKLDSRFSRARLSLAYSLILTNHADEAEREGLRVLGSEVKPGGPHYILGVVYLANRNAAKALEEANLALQGNGSFTPAFLLKTEALLLSVGANWRPEKRDQFGPILKDALESLEKYEALTPPANMSDFLREQLESLRFYVRATEQDKNSSDRLFWYPDEVAVKAHILQKSPPQYTEDARSVRMSGTVAMCVVLSAEGRVEHLLVLEGLPFGLNGSSIDAAKQISFTPGLREGHAVSMFMQLEYNFNLF